MLTLTLCKVLSECGVLRHNNPKASSADLCKLWWDKLRMWLHMRLCPVLLCRVSALSATSLDSIRFLTQILWDCVSKSGSQWEVGIVVSCKRSYPSGRRLLLCAHGHNLDGTTNWQIVLYKDVRKALAIQESPVFKLSKIKNVFAREYLLFFLSVSVQRMLAVLSSFW